MANEALAMSELKERSEAELKSLLASKQEELFGVKFNRALGQLSETHRPKLVRKDIARIQTELSARKNTAQKDS